MSPSTSSNKPPRLLKLVVPVVVVLQVELVQGQVVPPALDLAISISSEITLNFNNCDKSSNKILKCSSLSCNKLELVTHNWLL